MIWAKGGFRCSGVLRTHQIARRYGQESRSDQRAIEGSKSMSQSRTHESTRDSPKGTAYETAPSRCAWASWRMTALVVQRPHLDPYSIKEAGAGSHPRSSGSRSRSERASKGKFGSGSPRVRLALRAIPEHGASHHMAPGTACDTAPGAAARTLPRRHLRRTQVVVWTRRAGTVRGDAGRPRAHGALLDRLHEHAHRPSQLPHGQRSL